MRSSKNSEKGKKKIKAGSLENSLKVNKKIENLENTEKFV